MSATKTRQRLRVAAKILEVADSGTWELRHLVGPDARPLRGWRKTMTDEGWIELNAADDATFFASLGALQQ
ncbi:hypothetical protein [Tunturiibacter gelidiferens]|uniref:hypothetical protein n=1 Tax=Tunturiibacter gelidiferens TaxID=3069689 RepID=UPI003D9B8229